MADETALQRERLYSSPTHRLTAFSPRPVEKFVSAKPPVSNLKIECLNWYRQQQEDNQIIRPNMNFRLWMEAGKFYHSNKPETTISLQDVDWSVWRNYAHMYGYCDEDDPAEQKGRKSSVSTVEAAHLFPIAIPKPSILNRNTLGKFLDDNPKYIKSSKQRKLVISSTDMDVDEFRKLRLKSELRNPPIDRRGKILPPPNFKKYRPIHLDGVSPEEEDVNENALTVDVFGQPVKRVHEHTRIFLSSKLNCPTYAKVFEKIKDAMDSSQNRSKMATLLSATSEPARK